MKSSGNIVGDVERLMYIGFVLQKGFEEDMKQRIKYGWMKWREA